MIRPITVACNGDRSLSTLAARIVPATGLTNVWALSSRWSITGILSPRTSTTTATANTTNAGVLSSHSKRAVKGNQSSRPAIPTTSIGRNARRPAEAARPIPMASREVADSVA